MPATIGRDRRSAVSLVFAAAIVPLAISVGLAVDYSFYVETKSELSLAADTASMEAVRTAVADFTAGQAPAAAGISGQNAGEQWFAAQLGTLRTGSVAAPTIPPVVYDASTSTFTATVGYNGVVPTHFGGLLGISQWPVQGVSTAVITTNSYAEVVMLIDNSSSMLIGSSPQDIITLENATMCAPTATAQAAGQPMTAYSYDYPSGVGYGQGQTTPTQANFAPPADHCDPNFSGGAAQCPYPPALPAQQNPTLDAAGFCPTIQLPNGASQTTGIPNNWGLMDPVTKTTANIPQAPCAFACHTGDGVHDYYTIARSAGVVLRFDVIQSAAKVVVQEMLSQEQIPNQFSLGVFQFNSGVTQVHPQPSNNFVEADYNLTGGESDIAGITTPIVPDEADTNFPGAISYLAANLKPAGSGSTPTTPRKNIFIVTDGLEDYPPGAGRFVGPMDPSNCAALKTLGFNVYVLYTPYYPLPNPFYLNQGARTYVEPTVPPASSNPDVAALQACATKPSQFYVASSAGDIQTAMLAMLASALNTPARIAM